MSKIESQVDTATLASQMANMHTNEQNKAEIGIDISQVQVKPTLARGRKNWRRVGLAIATSRRFSRAIEKARAKNSYRNPLTGETIEWSERPMDDKVCILLLYLYTRVSNLLKPLSEKICNKTNFFNDTENIKWMLIAIPGNNKVYYGVLEGAVPMGVVKMGKGGYFKLHWHNGTLLVCLEESMCNTGEFRNRTLSYHIWPWYVYDRH